MGYDWTDVIEEACGDAKLSATKDQIETIAAWAEGHHDNYSMSHGYDCIGNVSESMEITSLNEPPRVSRRPNFLREYPNEKYLLT